ncbi:RHOMBOID-like protein 2 [Vigna angularis]|uniref:RHOMBOID-like protein 2 n=1 Tax=Phaseolus angularis TaxID=3914 RepID=UPI00080A3C10|nr:RHOMBOID-like protein 2 [Vigna angularis]
MEYMLKGKKMTVKGDPTLSRQLVEPKALLKLVDAESWVLMWDVGLVEQEGCDEWTRDLTREQQAELKTVLQAHYGVLQAHYRVFQEVQGLPPPRDTKHPYRIKFEIEKLGLIERQKIMARRDLETGGGRTKNNKTEENYTVHESSTPYEADTHWTSSLVPMFVVANIVVFVISMYINNCSKNNLGLQGGCVAKFLGRFSFELMQENLLLGPSSSTLTKMGALRWDNVGNRHQGWRLVTCIWLHTGIIHLLANMLSLVFIGIRMEQQFGFVRIGVIYLVTIQDQYPEFNLVDKVVEGEEGNVRT